MSDAELGFMRRFKAGETSFAPGTIFLNEGEGSEFLYTVLSGQGLRYKLLPDGGRQVLNFVFPGDFLGLQATVMGEMKHSVIASSQMRLCVFRRSEFLRLFHEIPQRGYDVTWVAAMEEHFLGEALATVGQAGATRRVAWALAKLFRRAEAVGMVSGDSCPLPYRQRDLADAVGLSLVHTNKTLARLRSLGVARWDGGRLTIHDFDRMTALADLDTAAAAPRPLI
ncbi:Crp/Fnr family transcriptional regulator [Plastorhodobacter daqingensis]|uniref:Crp/Fnr family transcriptional regulator n=1 Tax=Plastorhodobacter daqingensis TaxID=1387281 RepID=A0ABW2UP10_9RHOB